MHPLKVISLLSWLALFGFQLGLFWSGYEFSLYLALALSLPLLIPLRGLLRAQRYTYKWIGFMMLVYFCIGISELVSNPQLRVYGFGTSISSMLLFLASIYYARWLGLRARN